MSIELNGKLYRELRCSNCRRLICLEYISVGRIAYNCPRCGEQTVFNFKSLVKSEDNIVDWDAEFRIKSNNMKGGEKINEQRY